MLTDSCNDRSNLCDEPIAFTLDEWFANCMNLGEENLCTIGINVLVSQ